MSHYALYLESGPRRRKTMVHVLDLLGCTAQGPTTESALEATPEAIRAYLRFLFRHGEAVEPERPFTTTVAEHVTEGLWLGNGDPTPGFTPDFEPLPADELEVHLRRLAWLGEELSALIGAMTSEQLLAEPVGPGRSIYRIVEHVAAAHSLYLRETVGKVDSMAGVLRSVQPDPVQLSAVLGQLWQLNAARMEALTEEERSRRVRHGQVTWTARRGMRRMLEHSWEHLQEISCRLDTAGV